MIVGLVSEVTVRNFSKYSRVIGIVLGVVSFILCRKFLKVDERDMKM